MKQNKQERMNYTVEREFLGEITAAELISKIARTQIFRYQESKRPNPGAAGNFGSETLI